MWTREEAHGETLHTLCYQRLNSHPTKTLCIKFPKAFTPLVSYNLRLFWYKMELSQQLVHTMRSAPTRPSEPRHKHVFLLITWDRNLFNELRNLFGLSPRSMRDASIVQLTHYARASERERGISRINPSDSDKGCRVKNKWDRSSTQHCNYNMFYFAMQHTLLYMVTLFVLKQFFVVNILLFF